MTDKDVLTQDEIDALLSGVDEGEVDTEQADGPSQVSVYDLTNQNRVVRGRLPTVEVISERFARQLRAELPNNLKFPIEVGPGGVQVVKFSEYVDGLFMPTCIKLLNIEPFAGTCLLALDAKLIHRLVDRFFGGDGMANTLEGKEFTPTEQRVISRIINLVVDIYRRAWQDVLPISIEVVGEEINPALVNVLTGADALLVSSFRLDLEGGGGELHIAIPYASLEPYKPLLNATNNKDDDVRDIQWRKALERSLIDAELPLNCLIGDANLRFRDLLRLQPGDVIDLNMQDLHEVLVGNVPTFFATLGDSRGRFALEFDSFTQS